MLEGPRPPLLRLPPCRQEAGKGRTCSSPPPAFWGCLPPARNAPFFPEVRNGNGLLPQGQPPGGVAFLTPLPRGQQTGLARAHLEPSRTGPAHQRGDRCPRPATVSRLRPPGRPQNCRGMRGRPWAQRLPRWGVARRERCSLRRGAAGSAPRRRAERCGSPRPPARSPRACSAPHAACSCQGVPAPRRPAPRLWARGPLHGALPLGRQLRGSGLFLSVTRCLALSFQVLPVLLTCQTLEICS